MPVLFLKILQTLVLAFWFGLGVAPAVYAETTPANAEAVEKLQDRLVELEKETAVLKAEVDAQDKRIADGIGLHGAKVTELSNQTTQLGNYISYTSLALVLIGLVAGFFAFKRAEEIAKEWFEKNESRLHERIQHLSKQVEGVEKSASEAKSRMEKAGQDVDDHAAEVHHGLEQAKAAMAQGEKPSAEVVQQVEQDARDLNAKLRSQWTVDDFFNSAVYSYTAGGYDEALTRLDAVISMISGSPESILREQLAEALLLKGVTLRKMNRLEEALAAYKELLNRFGDNVESNLREPVAEALFGKGITLSKMNRHEEALVAYIELLSRFGDNVEPALNESVAKALLGKYIALEKLNRPEDAQAALHEINNRFDSSTESALLKIVELARKRLGDES
jgi:tetratricopeptide (TPR) repeat protein